MTITAFNAGHTLGGTVWKIRSPTSGTILYAVNLNHTKERHLDGTVLLKSGGASGVFEPLARPDLLITDAERTNVIGSRRKDRDAQLIGPGLLLLLKHILLLMFYIRYYHINAFISAFYFNAMRRWSSFTGITRTSRSTLEFRSAEISDVSGLKNWKGDVDIY